MIYCLKATTLRNVLGQRTLNQLLQDKENIANAMQTILDEATDTWYSLKIFSYDLLLKIDISYFSIQINNKGNQSRKS